MAVKDNNGLIYGIGKLKFNNKEIGWISQEGLSPKGEAKQTTPIYAAQVQDGPVDEITSSPGTTAFGFKLIQLKPEMCKDLFGGTIATADGAYVAIVGAIWPLLVMTGMHRVFTPTIVTTIAETGSEAMVMPSEIGANMSLGGVSLAVAFKTKNRELRQTALAAASSALIAGITEPALYGVAIRLKRPMIASVITGFIAGAVAGLAGLASHSMAAPGLFTSVQFIDKDNPTSILWIAAVMAISVVVSFALTLILGFEDIPVEEDEADMVTPASVKLMAPMKGAVMGLHDVADEVFSKGLLGKGMAIEPVDGKVVSPIAGTVTTVFPTKHAIGLTDDHGMEVLIHVGLDTVSLNGEPFEALVAAGDRVEVGTELLQADLDAIKAAGLPTTTVVVITNTDEFKDVTPVEPGNVS